MKILTFIGLWLFCLSIGYISHKYGIPSGWMMGTMFAAIMINLLLPHLTFKANPANYKLPMNVAQVIIALLAALPSSKSSLQSLLFALPLAIMISIVTAISAHFIAKMLMRKLSIDYSTAFLSLLPGGASAMTSIATENKSDVTFVVFTQYSRVIIISLLIPFMAYFFSHPSINTTHQSTMFASIDSWLVILAGLAMGYFFKVYVKWMPSPFLIPVVILAAILALSFPAHVPEIPRLAVIYAYSYIGVTAATSINRQAVTHFAQQIHWIFVSIVLMITICLICAFLLYYFGILNAFDAFLATAPGAIYIVFGFASEQAENGGVIVIMQIIRIIAVLVIAGSIPVLIKRKANAK